MIAERSRIWASLSCRISADARPSSEQRWPEYSNELKQSYGQSAQEKRKPVQVLEELYTQVGAFRFPEMQDCKIPKTVKKLRGIPENKGASEIQEMVV